MDKTYKKAQYWNPIDKKWQDDKKTPYLSPYFTSWEDLKQRNFNEIPSVQLRKPA